jgi:5-methylcytosine-specific restriction endonuclease McrA
MNFRNKKVAKAIRKRLTSEEGACCSKCGVLNEQTWLNVDHIIPVSVLIDMRITDVYADNENFRLLCPSCHPKLPRLDFSDSRTKKLLLKYLEQL